MSLTVSTPVKIFGIVAVAAALLLSGGMMMLGPSAGDPALDEPVLVGKQVALPKPAPKAGAKAKPAQPAAPKPKAPAKKPARKPQPVVAANGLPTAVMRGLAKSPVVVVALYDDVAKVDPLARDEAAAGARAAGAAFVGLDVTRDQKAAEAIMLKVGTVLRAPAVFVFTRPGEIVTQLDGFRDRDTVAQAALSAER